MPDFVWALHDFVPENPDEIPFKVGEKIEILERDDLYQDGWWQGRNPQGVAGLFPKSYTAEHPPATSTLSFPATPVSSPTADTQTNDQAQAPPIISLTSVVEEAEVSPGDERERTLSQGEQVMKATISDVQKAIEQLGRSDRDGAQSFSFASSHGDYTDRSETETDGDSDEDGQVWHKDAREKLAARAKQENEERKAKEAAESAQATSSRSIAPPIEVEMSDESEGEEDETHMRVSRKSQRHSDPYLRHSLIPEEDETEQEKAAHVKAVTLPMELTTQGIAKRPSAPSDSGSAHIVPSEEFIVPIRDESDLPTASVRQTSFPIESPSSLDAELSPAIPSIPSSEATPTMTAAQVDITPHPIVTSLPQAPEPQHIAAVTPPSDPVSAPALAPVSAPAPVFTPSPQAAPALKSVPSNIRIGEQLPITSIPVLPSPSGSSFSSNAPVSTFGAPQSATPATTVTSFKTANIASPEQRSSTPNGSKSPSGSCMEWSVEEVVDWLRSKGFDEGFLMIGAEQEITGDVLVELDQNVLKNEFGIAAFGKRARIVNAIAELRRPPSLDSGTLASQQQQPASRSQSINYSHSHTPSMQSSTHQSFSNSPLGQNGARFSPILTPQSVMYTSPSAPPLSAGVGSFLSVDSSPGQADFSSMPGDFKNGWRSSDPGSARNPVPEETTPRKDVTGLGLGFPNYPPSPTFNGSQSAKSRPSQLSSSRSDIGLKTSETPTLGTDHEDRGVLSDSETAHVSEKVKRRRLFGRSAESASLKEKASSLKDSSSRHSRDFSNTPISGPIPLGSEDAVPTRRQSKKRSGDERKASDRLSLFGSPFSGTLGKSRKPPPRLSTSLDRPEPEKPEKEKSHTLSTLTRMRPEKKNSGRPSTSDGTKPSEKEKSRELSPMQDRRDTMGVLRKRTASSSNSPSRPSAASLQATGGPALKPGKSILEQIGAPDHSGWMRKKGDRYNTWKLRYFVLKGPHLYCLKSNSTSETKIKGYVNIIGYRVQADENVDPGRYGFQIVHENDKTHSFSHEEQLVIREWMKALMKATISRDYTSPVVSSSNIPTIPLTVAQAMNPAPRPPSPTARDATQRAHRRENPNQLSSRDAQILMSLPSNHKANNERTRLDSFFNHDSGSTGGQDTTPKRSPKAESLQMTDPAGAIFGGLALLRLAEDIKGRASSPPVPDSAFPSGPHDDNLDGLFRLFDFLLDNDVKMGSVSINDIRQARTDKVVQLLRALKSWEDKRKTIAQSIGKGTVSAGPFIVERALLSGQWTKNIRESSQVVSLAKDVVEGKFHGVLTSPSARAIFSLRSDVPDLLAGSTETWFDLSLTSDVDPAEQELIRIVLATACLRAFLQANWTGPDLDINALDILTIPQELSASITAEFLHHKAVAELAYGGEPAYHLARLPILLRFAKILTDIPYSHFHTATWWRLRTWLVHQQVLDEPVAVPQDVFTSVEPLLNGLSSHHDLSGRLALEQGLLEHCLSHDKAAVDLFVRAARETKLEYELTGALGKRTKFQQKDVTQLVLLAESRRREDEDTEDYKVTEVERLSSNGFSDPQDVSTPNTLVLNDDTLLEQTQFTSSSAGTNSNLNQLDPSAQPALHPLDQCILLSLCLNIRNTSPANGLTIEQMKPYVARVISHPRNWSVHTMALLLRSRLESDRTRTVERAVLQLQALVDQMPTTDSSVSERLLYIHDIPLPSKWAMERELAKRFLSIGVVRSALDIFERLEMWEEVVQCWQSMEMRDKAVVIVRDLLEGKKAEAETVIYRGKATTAVRRENMDAARVAKLWCLLGELEPDHSLSHYERAWEISKHTSGRAMRSLGGYYFARGDFKNTIICLRRATTINPLLSRSWFILGCAYVREEDWDGAREAFARCVSIDDEDGESWNNLASVYLRLGEAGKELHETEDGETEGTSVIAADGESKSRAIPFANKMLAFRALKQGLKFSYENWRMWNNYMIVAMDVGELAEACRALGRVVEERSAKDGANSVDVDVLDRLVSAVTRGSFKPEANSATTKNSVNEGHGLQKRVSDLFDRIILPRVSSPRIFRARAKLLSWQGQLEEALKAYLEAYRNGVASSIEKGETDVEKWREGVDEVEETVDILRNFGPKVEGFKWKLQARSIARMFMAKTKDFEDEPEWLRLVALQEDVRKED
ncbi:hypothetical protein EUX98_g4312 [Antrodiella citrinella]|uniref:Uncharacterized protein n=1 Tax=Antrodiella citrinella TaxID=2447956 RepID=A0A4V3XIP3_9APHY|nr:hypothetical protein EUX98_g4312 [Antrodiella citrinella]